MEVERALLEADWPEYEDQVVQAVERAVYKYKSGFTAFYQEAIYQISIYTDPQSQTTIVSLETKQNADHVIQKMARAFETRGLFAASERCNELKYNTNPSEFAFYAFVVVNHPELRLLDEVDYTDNNNENAADAHIERKLLHVVDKLVSGHVLERLPHEPELWLGIGSPRSGYDHVHNVCTL